MAAPDLNVATLLDGAGLGTVGTDIFIGGMRPPSSTIPKAALFVLPTGGIGPLPLLDGGAADYSRPTVQILIRGDVGAYIVTQTKARDCLAAVQKATMAGYFQVLARNADPLYLGLDDTEHPIFSVNVELSLIA